MTLPSRIIAIAAISWLSLGTAQAANVVIAIESEQNDALVGAIETMQHGHPDEALAVLDKVIAAYAAGHHDGTYRCAWDLADAVKVGLVGTATVKAGKVTVLGPGWCTALWGKGYALIDLHRPAEAEAALAEAVEMAPTHAHFINEYAEMFKARREWQKSYDLFAKAWDVVDRAPQGPHAAVAARSLRGMAYAKVEMGDLADAERLLRQSLEINPGDAKSQHELDYVTRMKATRG